MTLRELAEETYDLAESTPTGSRESIRAIAHQIMAMAKIEESTNRSASAQSRLARVGVFIAFVGVVFTYLQVSHADAIPTWAKFAFGFGFAFVLPPEEYFERFRNWLFRILDEK